MLFLKAIKSGAVAACATVCSLGVCINAPWNPIANLGSTPSIIEIVNPSTVIHLPNSSDGVLVPPKHKHDASPAVINKWASLFASLPRNVVSFDIVEIDGSYGASS